MSIYLKIIILLLSLLGIVISIYIYEKKKKKERLTCYVGNDCNDVINSHFSLTFGIKNEILGYIFFTTTFILYWFSIFIKIPDSMVFVIILLTGLAFIFSVYLAIIQIFILKNTCFWCMFSAIIVTLIFILSLLGINLMNIANLLSYYYIIFIAIYFIALAVGLGMSISYKIIFSRFLKDYKITKTESNTLKTLSKAIFISLGVLLVSGFGISLLNFKIFESPEFVLQVIIILVLFIHAFVFKFYISEHLVDIRFNDSENKKSIQTFYYRILSFAANGVSITSWIFLFLLSIFYIRIPLVVLFLIYLFSIIISIILSLIKEYRLHKYSNE